MKGGKNTKMASLKEDAKTFQPKKTKNIADLPFISVDTEIYTDGKGTNMDGEEYTYSYLRIDGEEFYVPNAVRMQLKDILELRSDMKTFKVEKSGTGMQTKYKVKFLS